MSDAASVMTETISEFNSGQPSTPASSPPPPAEGNNPPAPPPAPASAPSQATETASEGETQTGEQQSNWYEQLLAQDQQPDPWQQLALDEQAFAALQSDQAKLLEYATSARQFLAEQAQQRQEEAKYAEDFEWFGGRQYAPVAARLAGDLFRGNDFLTEEEARQFGADGPTTYVERFLEQVKGQHAPTAYELGAAILNRMPDLLKHNEDYVLHALGFNPKLKEDFRQVMIAGGFTPSEDGAADGEFLKTIPGELHDTYRKLPHEVRSDLRNRPPGVAQFDLQQYARTFAAEEKEKATEAERVQQMTYQVEQQATRGLASNTTAVFEDYVKKGEALGLDPLQAAGAAALAYKEIESQYWDEQSEAHRVLDDWYARIKTGNKLQIEQGRKAYQRVFEQAYRRALSQSGPKRPNAPQPPNAPRRPNAPQPPGGPQFNPDNPPDNGAGATGADLMNQILRQYGAIS